MIYKKVHVKVKNGDITAVEAGIWAWLRSRLPQDKGKNDAHESLLSLFHDFIFVSFILAGAFTASDRHKQNGKVQYSPARRRKRT